MFSNKINIFVALTLFIGMLFTATAVQAQAANQGQATILTGKVMDAETGQPVSGVTVEIEGIEKKSDTNKRGMFSFSELQPGSHTIIIEADGYKKFTKEVDLNERGKNLNVELQPAGSSTR